MRRAADEGAILAPGAPVVSFYTHVDVGAAQEVAGVRVQQTHRGRPQGAHLRDGRVENVVFHSGLVRRVPTQGFVRLHIDEVKPEDVKKFVLERTDWVSGIVRDVELPLPTGGLSGDDEKDD